jgi:hypothetical protein
VVDWEATLRQNAVCSFLDNNFPCPGAGAIRRRHVSARCHYSKNHPICQRDKGFAPSCGDDRY